jgi:AcrR family transcriptional regulator
MTSSVLATTRFVKNECSFYDRPMPKVSEEHRLARREQILVAASRCVAREGFHKTTMADVIREAGLSAGAVYGYFKGKNDIIRAIAERSIGQVPYLLHDLLDRSEPVHPVDAVEVFLHRMTALVEETGGDLPRVGVQAWAEAARDPELHALAAEQMGAVRSALEDVVRRAQHDGTVSAQADARAMAQVLFALLPGYVLELVVLEDVSPASYVAGLRDLLR